MRLGAIDYLRKPVDVRELHRLIERVACATARFEHPARVVAQADGLLVAGPAMAAVTALADRLHAASDMPCLIEAETGCGKELVARRIHHGGRPDTRPFVALNCAAIPAGLFEAELFGHAAGAFTGAAPGGAPGKLAAAAGGTIFLDEIGELPTDQQAKLLRVLEERAFYPVGSTRMQPLTARVVCASNRDLFRRSRDGAFREDLLYRLKVGFVRVPPLRERRDEIVPLALGLCEAIRQARRLPMLALASDAHDLLRGAAWPGNVRQLRHVLERAALEQDGGTLGRARLAQALEHEGSPSGARPATRLRLTLPQRPPAQLELPEEGFDLDGWYGAFLAAALARNDGSPVRTAAYLGISRKVLYTLRKRHGLMEPGE
jgi:DNA-binding NtrC family response regulator